MSQIPKPTNIPAQQVLTKRTVSTSRHRETQPAYEQPRQDTLSGANQINS